VLPVIIPAVGETMFRVDRIANGPTRLISTEKERSSWVPAIHPFDRHRLGLSVSVYNVIR